MQAIPKRRSSSDRVYAEANKGTAQGSDNGRKTETKNEPANCFDQMQGLRHKRNS